MSSSDLKSISKFLSYILRHNPDAIGLAVDRQGWAHLPALIKKARKDGKDISREKIEQVINSSGKQRFRISEEGSYIRAGYGHSIDEELNLDPQSPPEVLYHGTARCNLESIRSEGLRSAGRKLVHLSASISDAMDVGSRHGKAQLLTIQARRMYGRGHPFYQSDSEPSIWLVDAVPPQFIEE